MLFKVAALEIFMTPLLLRNLQFPSLYFISLYFFPDHAMQYVGS